MNRTFVEPEPAVSDESSTVPTSSAEERALYLRVTLRIVPLLFVCYVVAFLDRINVGFAKLQMQDALGFSDSVYGLGAGIFFLSYCLLEVPSAMLLRRVGAKKTIARIMICWGIVGMCTAFVTNVTEFYAVRLLLGVFEAGFFPGVIFYLSSWFPEKRRGVIIACFMVGFPVAGLVGGPVSGWAMTQLAHVANMAGWQWLYIVEALPAVALGIVTLFLLDDNIDKARWLSESEKKVLRDGFLVETERKRKNEHRGHGRLADALADPKVYMLAFIDFAFVCGTYSVTFWLPTVMKDSGISNLSQLGWLSTIPYAMGAIGMVAISRSSDRMLERRWHAACAGVVGAVALLLVSHPTNSPALTVTLLTFASIGIFATNVLIWSLAADYLHGSPAAAASIAFVNCIGLLSGFCSPFVIGWLKTMTGTLVSGLYVMTAILVLGIIVMLVGFKPQTSKPV
ncbi:MFS transporter [Caballeronia sp. LP006]|uniref:MFS transporter n=1 Tax=Caballeronia sp. LP006 TaxID=3038552 RepID=UPI00285A122D|nr:MFS transporter [Caballeronia sp. LP006]MDR5827641.1 MFS transporter [Caballeronia sp. LP006]